MRISDWSSDVCSSDLQILKVEDMTDYDRGTTATVSKVSGGTANNVVPHQCRFAVDVRITNTAEGERMERATPGPEPVGPDVALTVGGGIHRPASARPPGVAEHTETARAEAVPPHSSLPEL